MVMRHLCDVQGMDKIMETLDNIGIKLCIVCTKRTLVVSFIILLSIYTVWCQCQSITDRV